MKRHFSLLSIVVLTTWATTSAQVENQNNHFEVGLGLLVSSDYKKAMVESYSSVYDISGAFGWIDLAAGYSVNLVGRLFVIPRVRFLVRSIEVKGFTNLPSSRKANSVLLPGVAIRYALGGINTHFYVDGYLSSAGPHSDLSGTSFESDGVAIGAELGMVIGHEYEFGIGYHHIPIKIILGAFESRTANFGGFGLIARRRL